MDKDYILKKLQDTIYEMLIRFDEVCEKNELTYYLFGGALLGAVRHGEFIPWDDDIDVAMPREDYDRLLTNFKNYFSDQYDLQNNGNTKNYHLNFSKIINKNTTVVEQDGKNNYRIGGVFLDIFPIDGAGDTYKKALRRRKMAIPLLKLSAWSSYPSKKIRSKPFMKRFVLRVTSILDGVKTWKLLERFLKKESYSESKYVIVYSSPFKYKEIMRKEVYGNPIKIKFKDYDFNAPSKPEEHLTIKYGDYMQLPPEEKRKSNHNIVFVDVNLPYKDFDLNSLSKK